MATDGPGSRSGAALVYDARKRRIVLFGGVGHDRRYLTGTWTWDGVSRRLATVEGPSPRASHQLVYDSRTGVVILYGGGNHTGRLQDMWKWDGHRWTDMTTSGPTPGPRNGHAMAYDDARGRLVLHGGFGAAPHALGDTWEWDGSGWQAAR
jgi:hypothetical protein